MSAWGGLSSAERRDSLPRVRTTLRAPEWEQLAVIGGDIPGEAARLKAELTIVLERPGAADLGFDSEHMFV